MRCPLLLALLLASPALAERVTLRFDPPIAATAVALTGSFHEWSPEGTPMQAVGDRFEVTLDLPPGRHLYKFVVDGRTWLKDPANPLTEPDGHGGENSVLEVRPAGPPARRDDPRIQPGALAHRPADPLHRRLEDGQVHVAFEARERDLSAAWVQLPSGERRPLTRRPLPAARELWTGALPSGAEAYRFVLASGANLDGLGAAPRAASRDVGGGAMGRSPGEVRWTPRPEDAGWLSPRGAPRLTPSPWVEDAVFYQVFPDRFANGDPTNDPADALPFGSTPDLWHQQGGDLAGLRAHLGEIRAKGFTGLYLNPVFAGASNHKYDASDYLRVDPSFGTEADLAGLVADAHALGMRVILDGVFNHTGDTHWAFQDLVERGPASEYAGWYTVHEHPARQRADGSLTYAGWWDFAHLPELVTTDPGVRDHVREVVRHWARRAEIDGWRLDVANEVEHPFWKDFRRWVRAEDPDAYLVGEVWTDGHPWMQGDEFDGVMNYRLRSLLLDFWVHRTLDGPGLLDAVARLEASHPPPMYRGMMNLLGSHDTPRLRTVAKGDRDAVRGAFAFLFTSPGAPTVYYGDEVGVEGEKDPDCRRVYPHGAEPWPELAAELTALAGLREGQPVLKRAALEPLASPPHWVAFRRGPLVCVLRRAGEGPDGLALDLPGGRVVFGPGGAWDPGAGRVVRLAPGRLLVLEAR